MPIISVIVPVYKVEPYLRRCIDSILSQTFADFELILIDDGSPDSCGAICDEYASRDSRVHVIHQKNSGVSAARNAGIDWAFSNSDSCWLGFIDSDDWVHPKYLEALLGAAQATGSQISVCDRKRVSDFEPFHNREITWTEMTSDELYLLIAQRIKNNEMWGKLYKKELFRTIRFPGGKIWEDVATLYKLFASVDRCSVVNEELYYYFQNSSGFVLSSWTPRYLGELTAYEQQLDFFSQEERWADIHRALQKTYILSISYSYYWERKSELPEKEKAHYADVLKKKMRKALSRYGKTAGVTFRDNPGVYETAYPRLMNLYWIIKGKMDMLRRARVSLP